MNAESTRMLLLITAHWNPLLNSQFSMSNNKLHVELVWLCGEKRKIRFGEEMHVYGGGGCKTKRDAKEDLVGSD